MIFRWLLDGLKWILRMTIFPPPRIPAIDPNDICPSCGARDGHIRAVTIDGKMFVQHNCHVCVAQWNVKPVLKVNDKPKLQTTPEAAPETPKR